MPAAGASLLLNLESVLTALLAWFVFRENFDRRIALGMAAIVLGSVVLNWPGHGVRLDWTSLWPGLAVIGACLGWALDNNFTRKVALSDAGFIAMSKGLIAGTVNLLLAMLVGAQWPTLPIVLAAARSVSPATASVWCCSCWRCGIWARRAPGRISPWRRFSAPRWPCSCSAKPSRRDWCWRVD
jgi:EamA-like transporter family.